MKPRDTNHIGQDTQTNEIIITYEVGLDKQTAYCQCWRSHSKHYIRDDSLRHCDINGISSLHYICQRVIYPISHVLSKPIQIESDKQVGLAALY